MGLLRDQDIDPRSKEILVHVQNKLFTVGAILATPPEKEIMKNGKERLNISKISEEENFALKWIVFQCYYSNSKRLI